MNVVNVESLKKAGDIDNETIHDNDDKIVVGVLLPRQLEANNDVVAKEHGVTRRQIVIKTRPGVQQCQAQGLIFCP